MLGVILSPAEGFDKGDIKLLSHAYDISIPTLDYIVLSVLSEMCTDAVRDNEYNKM